MVRMNYCKQAVKNPSDAVYTNLNMSYIYLFRCWGSKINFCIAKMSHKRCHPSPQDRLSPRRNPHPNPMSLTALLWWQSEKDREIGWKNGFFPEITRGSPVKAIMLLRSEVRKDVGRDNVGARAARGGELQSSNVCRRQVVRPLMSIDTCITSQPGIRRKRSVFVM